MSGAHGPKGLTRRSFLKTTGAAGVAAVAAGAAAPQLAAIAEGYEPGQPETQGGKSSVAFAARIASASAT